MSADDAVADRSAVVLLVEAEVSEFELDEPAFDDLRDPVEREGEVVRIDGVPEAWVIRRNDVEPSLGERRHQVAPLMRGGREAAEQDHLRVARIAGLPVEQLHAVDGDGLEFHLATFRIGGSAD